MIGSTDGADEMRKGDDEMPKNRIQHLGAIGLVVTVGLLLVLAVQVGLTGATNGTPGASASGALQGKVRIDVKGKTVANTSAARGRFTMSGAISDRGSFVDSGGLIIVRKLAGAKGTIWVKVGFVEPFPCQRTLRPLSATLERSFRAPRAPGAERKAEQLFERRPPRAHCCPVAEPVLPPPIPSKDCTSPEAPTNSDPTGVHAPPIAKSVSKRVPVAFWRNRDTLTSEVGHFRFVPGRCLELGWSPTHDLTVQPPRSWALLPWSEPFVIRLASRSREEKCRPPNAHTGAGRYGIDG
jgi:hypothetical protein